MVCYVTPRGAKYGQGWTLIERQWSYMVTTVGTHFSLILDSAGTHDRAFQSHLSYIVQTAFGLS